jgi:hypothetical protein
MTDEKFFAWLDGELDVADAEAMRAEVAADPELAARAEQHRAMQVRLTRAFSQVAAAPLPERLSSAVSRTGREVVDLASRREAREGSRRFKPVPQWAMIAATLVLGLFVGNMIPGRSNAPIEMQGEAIYAAGDLAAALDTQLASAEAAGDVRVGMTYRNSDGGICRTFSGAQATGLACRSQDRWTVQGLFPAAEGQQGAYRMAAGMNPALAELIDSSIAGEPLDAAQEAAARQRGWR